MDDDDRIVFTEGYDPAMIAGVYLRMAEEYRRALVTAKEGDSKPLETYKTRIQGLLDATVSAYRSEGLPVPAFDTPLDYLLSCLCGTFQQMEAS